MGHCSFRCLPSFTGFRASISEADRLFFFRRASGGGGGARDAAAAAVAGPGRHRSDAGPQKVVVARVAADGRPRDANAGGGGGATAAAPRRRRLPRYAVFFFSLA